MFGSVWLEVDAQGMSDRTKKAAAIATAIFSRIVMSARILLTSCNRGTQRHTSPPRLGRVAMHPASETYRATLYRHRVSYRPYDKACGRSQVRCVAGPMY